jgi:hypothetical protein
MFSDGMWIFYLESALALGMFVFIVWWTLPKKPRDKQQASGYNAEQKVGQNHTTSGSRDVGVAPSAGRSDNAGNASDTGNNRAISDTQKPHH